MSWSPMDTLPWSSLKLPLHDYSCEKSDTTHAHWLSFWASRAIPLTLLESSLFSKMATGFCPMQFLAYCKWVDVPSLDSCVWYSIPLLIPLWKRLTQFLICTIKCSTAYQKEDSFDCKIGPVILSDNWIFLISTGGVLLSCWVDCSNLCRVNEVTPTFMVSQITLPCSVVW